jgi:hypothetical protein
MDVVGSFLSSLAGQGIVGVVLAACFYLIWYLTRELQRINDKRVADAQELSGKILEPINAIKQNSDLLISLFTRFLNSNGNNNKE